MIFFLFSLSSYGGAYHFVYSFFVYFNVEEDILFCCLRLLIILFFLFL